MMSKNKFTGISCKPEIKEKIASLGKGKETWDELLEFLYLKVVGNVRIVSVELFDDQVEWIRSHDINLSKFVQDSLDDWMYKSEEARAKIDERRLQSMKAFSEE